jgi:hypothetical protein
MRNFPSVSRLRHLLLLALALSVIACGPTASGSSDDDLGLGGDSEMRSVLIRWRASDDVAGYVVYWGRTPGAYTEWRDVGAPAADPDGVIEYFLDQKGPGGTLYFALTSYDAARRMSGFSNELSAAVP